MARAERAHVRALVGDRAQPHAQRLGAPWANVSALRAAFGAHAGLEPGHATTGPAGVAGHCESANLSQRVAINLLHSQCERRSGTVRVGESVPVAHPESVREWLPMRSQSGGVAPGRATRHTEPRAARASRGCAFLAERRGDARLGGGPRGVLWCARGERGRRRRRGRPLRRGRSRRGLLQENRARELGRVLLSDRWVNVSPTQARQPWARPCPVRHTRPSKCGRRRGT